MSEEPAASAVPSKPPPRPSGLRPPSKIGRLCAAATPKPAVPPSPKTNETTTEAMRRISDDYSRKHLADVQEADEETEANQMSNNDNNSSTKERKNSTCSTYSITSMDALWEKDPRRLSEAGLRRTSDHSIVLTEDTDGFIIGDRVYVGGNKPGNIAYIGDTQFAPGEWAGVVLDESIGKNDGSVAGIRYFQCEPKKGVFSRLTRLTREPLTLPSPTSPASDKSSIISEKPPVVNEQPPQRIRHSRSASPNGSVKSNTSRMSTVGELRMGERVIVSSSQGSKAGTLRYLGFTEFAGGQWCGVELDDPIGKNDGSVEGVRYFECAPRFGLFAPLAKVSRSPSKRRPGTCAVHGRGSPPDSLTSSIISNATSTRPRLGVTSLGTGNQRLSGARTVSTPMSAKSTLQELLREKQQHIEKLMIELDSEKNELAKTSVKADNLQTELNMTKTGISKYHEEIERLKLERDNVSRVLEDEKQKVDDLMFRAEEDNIHKEDFNKLKDDLLESKEKQTIKINLLEKEVADLKSHIDDLQMQSDLTSAQHKAELDILTSQQKDESKANQVLASELQSLLDEAHTLLREKNTEIERINKNHSEELFKNKTETEKLLNELKAKLSETQVQLSSNITLVSSSQEKLDAAEKHIITLNEKLQNNVSDNNNVLKDLRNQIEEKQTLLDAKIQEYNQTVAVSKETEISYKKEIEKLKMQNSALNIDYETTIETRKKLENDYQTLKSQFDDVKSKLSHKESEIELFSMNASKEHDTIQNEAISLRKELLDKNSHIEKMEKESVEQSDMLRKEIENLLTSVDTKDKECLEIKSKMEEYKNEISSVITKSKEEFEKAIQEKDNKMDTIVKQFLEEKLQLNNELEKIKQDSVNIAASYANEKELLERSLKELNEKAETLSNKNNEINQLLSVVQKEKEHLQNKAQKDMTEHNELLIQKEKLEKEVLDMINNSSNSDEQLSMLTNKIKEAENEVHILKENNSKSLNVCYQNEEKLNHEINRLKTELEEAVNLLNQKLKASSDEKEVFEEQIQNLKNNIIELQENCDKTIVLLKQSEEKFTVEKLTIVKELEIKDEEQISLKKQYDNVVQESEKRISELNTNIESMRVNFQSMENEMKEKINKLLDSQNNLTEKLNNSENNEKHLQELCNNVKVEKDDISKKLETLLLSKENNEKTLNNDVQTLKNEYDVAKKQLADYDVTIRDLQQKNSELNLELKSNNEIILEKERQIGIINNEKERFLNEKHCIEKEHNEIIGKNEVLLQNFNKLSEEKNHQDTKILNQETLLNGIKIKIAGLMDIYDIKTENFMKNTDESILVQLVDKIKDSYQKLSVLQKDIENSSELHIVEISNLKVENSKLRSETDELNRLLLELRSGNEKMVESQELIKQSEEEYRKKVEISENEKQNYKILHEQTLNELETLRKESENNNIDVMAKQSTFETQMSSKNKEIEEREANIQDLHSKLNDSENTVKTLQEKLSSLEIAANQKKIEEEKEKQSSLFDVENIKKSHIEEVSKFEKQMQTLSEEIKMKNNDLDTHSKQLLALNDDLRTCYMENDKMKQEVYTLKNKIKEYENNNHILKLNTHDVSAQQKPTTVDTQRLLEEKQEVEGQVNFLNSVIVDMQKKNEELKARVEILEMGVTPQEIDEFSFNGFKHKKVAPRMFCDICDVFDAHETEDCPRQSDEVEVKPKEKKKPPAQRPYCDMCEVFGHATEDCDEETY